MRKIKFYYINKHQKKTYVYYVNFNDEATVSDIQKTYKNWIEKIIDTGWEEVCDSVH